MYFAGSDELVSDHATTTGDPLRAARLAINGQVVTAAGLIVVAVGYETAIHEPLAPAGLTLSLLLFGGPLLYLGLQTWYLRALTGRLSRTRLVGAAALVGAGAVAWFLPAVLTLAVSSVLLGVLAVCAAIASHHAPRPVT